MIALFGYGFVGRAIFAGLKRSSFVTFDPALTSDRIGNYKPTAFSSAIIAVSTPSREDGSCNGDNVRNVISEIPVQVPILIKSALSLEEWRRIKSEFPQHKVGFSPEFLRGEHAIEDFANEKFQIFGSDSAEVLDNFTDVWLQSFPDMKFDYCSAEEAILVKYAENSFLALKVGFFNHLKELSDLAGVDFENVRRCLTTDTRIGPDHSHVPGTDGKLGWGGHCLPKDTSAMIATSKSLGYDYAILNAAIKYNNKIRDV